MQSILDKVNAQVARAHAKGLQDTELSVYEHALTASAEAFSALNTSLDDAYDSQYAVIQLMENAEEKQAALEQLNTQYNEKRLSAAMKYAETLATVIMPVWNETDIQDAAADVAKLTTLLAQYSAANESDKPGLLT